MNVEKLRTLWDGHSKVLYAYLLRLTKSEADAADFLQDVFCRLGRQPELVERLSAEPRGYLLRLAHNVVVDHARRAQAKERIFEKISAARVGEFAAAEDPDEALLRRELLAALEGLPDEQRVVVHARLWKMRTLDDIARELGVSINTAASRYRYGIDKMRTRLRSLYEDFSSEASAQPTRLMKNDPKTPFNGSAKEEPIIRPLEQRRVPSATGAAFALPVLPENPDDAHGDEIPVDDGDPEFDPAVCYMVIDPVPTEHGEIPVSFDDLIPRLHAMDPVKGELGDPCFVEEFNPDVIFYTMFNSSGGENGEVIDYGDGIGDGKPIFDHGDGGEPVAGEVHDDGTGTIYTLDMIKRGGAAVDGGTEGAGAGDGEFNPEILYMTAGGHAPGAVDHPEAVQGNGTPDEVDHSHDTPAPAHAADSHVSHGTTAPVPAPVNQSTSEITFETASSGDQTVVFHDDLPAPVQHFEVTLPSGLGELTAEHHDFHAEAFAPSVVQFEAHGAAHDSTEFSAVHDATHADATVDEWVPMHTEAHDAGMVAHFDPTSPELPAEHGLHVVAPGDLAAHHDVALQGSALAMAATGSVLLTRDAKSRKDEVRA